MENSRILVFILSAYLHAACGETREPNTDLKKAETRDLWNSSENLQTDNSVAAKPLMLGGIHYQRLELSCNPLGNSSTERSVFCRLTQKLDGQAIDLEKNYDVKIDMFDDKGKIIKTASSRFIHESENGWLIEIHEDKVARSVHFRIKNDFVLDFSASL